MRPEPDYTPRYPDTVFANALWGFRPILNAAIADVSAGKPVRDITEYADKTLRRQLESISGVPATRRRHQRDA